MTSLVSDIGIIIIAATFFSILAKILRQPLILGYLFAGVIIGPFGLGLIKGPEAISRFSELGIAFLLFIVGLELDVRKVKNLGWVVLAASVGQVFFTFLAGYFILKQFALLAPYAGIVSIALTMSSTVIVVKLYSEKKELNTLHGRIVLGILLIQDFIAVLTIASLSNKTAIAPFTVSIALAKASVLFIGALLAGRYILTHLFKFFAYIKELLFMSSLMCFFAFALIAEYFGLSQSIGAFLAGISLAFLPYTVEIESKISSLRDFFATIFFVLLGMQIQFTTTSEWIFPVVLVSVFVLVGNPLIVFLIASVLGFKSRTSFFSGIAIAQISEFSLIFILLARSMKLVTQDVVSFTAIIAVITFTISAYMITYEDRIYRFLSKFLKLFEKIAVLKREYSLVSESFSPNILVCGYDSIGRGVVNHLKKYRANMLAIDYNPATIEKLRGQKIPALYGDIGDSETYEKIKLEKVTMVISTVEELNSNLLLINNFKAIKSNAIIFVTAVRNTDALKLYGAGADYVLVPQITGADFIISVLQKYSLNKRKLLKYRNEQIKELIS